MAGIDAFIGHRVRNRLCKYWKKRQGDSFQDAIWEREPDGLFYAKQESGRDDSDEDIGPFRVGKSTVTISTADRVDVEDQDIVLYRGERWIVEDRQVREIEGKSEFCPTFVTYLRLRK